MLEESGIPPIQEIVIKNVLSKASALVGYKCILLNFFQNECSLLIVFGFIIIVFLHNIIKGAIRLQWNCVVIF